MQCSPFDPLATRPTVTPTQNQNATFAAARVALDQLREELLAMRTPRGNWEGELSASALSTATAISALSVLVLQGATEPSEAESLISRGLAYLDSQQNSDGGYGDTDRSHSNIATSYLVLAARTLAARALNPAAGSLPDPSGSREMPNSRTRLDDYIASAGGLDGLRRRYGKDKTFVVPILTNLAIAGLVEWKTVPRLPFEAAVFPGAMYRFLQMPVVSYAIPALVAIGQVHHFRGPRTWWPLRQLRSVAVAPTMRVLQRMQPDSGGYLEATPLTSFVLMSLAASGRGQHPVAIRCLEFLKASIRPEGSWPIDTNLATWVTSLAIHALAQDPSDNGSWATPSLIDWHLGCQHRKRHPFTGADPGGWGWTDHSGAVPDGDDTPAAILAIDQYLTQIDDPARMAAAQSAVARGASWLLDLQNRDGGLPTFCRGWGKLPFDRSSTDLTAHLLRALEAAERIATAPEDAGRIKTACQNGLRFLRLNQRTDGHWVPLWFGNQDHPEEENPIYGTGRVLLAIAELPPMQPAAARATDFLLSEQNSDGGWGGGPSRTPRSSLEETAVAVEALVAVTLAMMRNRTRGAADFGNSPRQRTTPLPPFLDEPARSTRERQCREAILAGVRFLTDAVVSRQHRDPWPIGFYFAKLWYHEKMYPIVLTMAALGAALRCFPLSDENRDTKAG